MDDMARGRLAEDVIGHCMAKKAADEAFRKGCFLGEVSEGDRGISRNMGGEVIGIDGAEREDVCELWQQKNVMSAVGLAMNMR